jgi:hypothetical protein
MGEHSWVVIFFFFFFFFFFHQSFRPTFEPLESKSLISPITDMPTQDDNYLIYFLALPYYQGKDIVVFRFIIEYIVASLRDFFIGPLLY